MLTTNSFNGKGAEQSAPLKLMKIKTNRDMRIDGAFVSAGSTVEVEDKDARYLIANNLLIRPIEEYNLSDKLS